jgi:D-aminopeptidase
LATKNYIMKSIILLVCFCSIMQIAYSQKPRARDIGIPFDGVTGKYNAITDAPLLPHQLKRLAARVAIGVGKMGGRGENGSGDIFITFSTANANAFQRKDFTKVDVLPNDMINPLFDATVQAVEEAIVNAMVAAETMEGINGNKAYALPHKLVMDVLKNYNRVK